MALISFSGHVNSSEIDNIIKEDQIGLNASQQAQIKIEAIDDKNLDIVEQYRQVIREQQLANKYNQLLSKQINQLETALLELETKQAQLRKTRMMLVPLMNEMVQSLAILVNADTPFLLPERQARIDHLQRQLVDATLSESDKILSVLDAYQVELSYGYTTESWQGKVDGNLVNFIRIGRLGFYYYSPDEQKAAIWNHGWKPLSSEWVPQLKHAAQVAAGHQLPALLTLPFMNIEAQ